MGVQLFPALQDYNKYHFWEPSLRQVDWKSVPHHLEELDTLAAKLGIESLYRFINTTRDDTPFDDETMDGFESDGELIDEAWYYQGQMLWSVELKWFDPGQGLITVRQLISYLHSVQDELEIESALDQDENEIGEDDYAGVVYELEEMEKILSQAQRENKSFRLCISG